MEERTISRIVVDCSIIMAHILPDEDHEESERIIHQIQMDGVQVLVPALFCIEVNNVLYIAHKRNRIDRKQWDEGIHLFQNIPFETDQKSTQPGYMSRMAELSRTNDLTIYDATYLELALRSNAQLATLDEQLKRAAQKYTVYYSAR